MYRDENKSSSLAKYLNGFDYVIIDTCSLMEESFPEWMEILHKAKAYRKKGLDVIVPRKCFDELKKHAASKGNDAKRIDAKRGLRVVRRARFFRVIKITKKDPNENFADNAIYVRVSGDRLFARILIVTQDKKLASDLLALNQLKSQNGRALHVCKLIPGGRLVPNKGEDESYKEHKGHGAPNKDPQNKTPSGVEEILLADARLSAVLNNPNYPSEKKAADAKAQIKALQSLPDSMRAQLDLNVPLSRLNEVAGEQKKATPVLKKQDAPKKEEAPKKSEPKAKDPNRLWYEKGATIVEGIAKVCEYYGIHFHEPAVKYFPEGHGPFDLTTKDLEAIEQKATPLLNGEEKAEFEYRGLPLAVQHVKDYYRCWVDANHLPKELSPLPKAPAPKKAKVQEEEPQVEEKPAPAKAKKPAAKKPAATEEKPSKAVETEEKPKAARAKKPAKTTEVALTAEVVKEEKKPAPKTRKKTAEATTKEETKADEEKPTPAKTKKAPAKKAPVKDDAPKAKKPAAEKPVEKKPEPVQEEPKKNDEDPLALALRKQRRLQAVLPNGNYPIESKAKDVKAQIELLRSIPEEEQSKFQLGIPQLQAWLDENATK